MAHPARPGLATEGKKVMIRANHFLVNVADNNLFHYDVSINPESKSRQTNRGVLNELIKLHGKTALGGKLPAYDGRKSLYTAGSLPFESEEFAVTLVDPEKKDKERAEREYKITIRIAGRTDLYHLQQFLRGRQRDMPQETIQVLDVVLRESPSWNYVTVSRSFFSTTFGHRGDIGEGLECWRGYYQSLRPTQMGLSLNIDISATSFFKPVTVIRFVEEFLNLRDTSRPLSDRDRVKIKKALRGVRIETTHQQDQIRRYKITGLTSIPMSQLIFPVDDKGTRKTVVQYFWDKYNYSLKYGSWPCLQAGSDSRPVYLPMEVCKIVEGQRYSKKLNDKQVTLFRKRGSRAEQSIRDMVLHNKYADDRFAQEFGIKVSSDLVLVPARVLPPPMLKYHDSGREKTCAPSIGQWNMIGKKMINGGTIDNWTCLNFSRMRPDEVQRFCMDLIHMCNATGMAVNPRPFVDVKSAAPNHIENALRDVHRRATQMLAQQGVGNQLQLLIIILPDVSGSYGKIKRVCETDIGIVSQCCLPKHASRPNKQYLENVALKINVKVGGRNTVLERAFVRNGIPFVSEVPTIIFGADVTHPPPGEDSASSIAAVVASMDWPEITKYRGLVSAQPHRQEIIEDLFTVTKDPQKGHNVNGGMIGELLIAFRRKTSRRPERIIFYRDGVSEGQFSHVLLHEMDAIRKACASFEEGYLPPVTFVVVQKRHHTRLFPEVNGRRDMTDKSGNILPGTVVDQQICHPTEFDFYLCSLTGIQGTSRPTHYHVLYDENYFTADALQSLTNNLWYISKIVGYQSSLLVPPAYYFHLAAFRARYYVEGKISDGGSTPGSRGQTVAREGPVEVPQRDSSVKDESECISITIHVFDRKFDVHVPKNSCLEFIAEKTMEKIKVRLTDVFVIKEGKSVKPNTIFSEGCTLSFRHRLRGGCTIWPFRDMIAALWSEENWFEIVDIPECIRIPGAEDHKVGLAPGAQWAFSAISLCLEAKHENGRSFTHGFGLDQVWYDSVAKTVAIDVPWDEDFTQTRYKLNEDSFKSILDEAFRYTLNGQKQYPMHVKEVAEWISDLKDNGSEFSSNKTRSIVFLSAATWSACERNSQLDQLMNYYHHLPSTNNAQQKFREALGEKCQSGKFQWFHVLDRHGRDIIPPEINRILSFKVYNEETDMMILKGYADNFFGRLDLSRCLVAHVNGDEATPKQVDAALYAIAPRQQLDLRLLLLLGNIKPTVKKWLPKEGGSHVAPSTSSAITANTASSSVTPDYFSFQQIPVSNHIQIYEIFGFKTEPKN